MDFTLNFIYGISAVSLSYLFNKFLLFGEKLKKIKTLSLL